MKQPSEYKPDTQVLIDRAIEPIRAAMEKLQWIDRAFGKSYREIKRENGIEKTYPAIYTGSAEYLNMFPDGHLGNYCFFIVDDPYTIASDKYYPFQQNSFKTTVRIVFWFDERKVFDYSKSNKELLKLQALNVLKRYVGSNVWSVEKIMERPENVYRGFNGYKEIQDQFCMYPYGLFSIECEVIFCEDCMDGEGNIIGACCTC